MPAKLCEHGAWVDDERTGAFEEGIDFPSEEYFCFPLREIKLVDPKAVPDSDQALAVTVPDDPCEGTVDQTRGFGSEPRAKSGGQLEIGKVLAGAGAELPDDFLPIGYEPAGPKATNTRRAAGTVPSDQPGC